MLSAGSFRCARNTKCDYRRPTRMPACPAPRREWRRRWRPRTGNACPRWRDRGTRGCCSRARPRHRPNSGRRVKSKAGQWRCLRRRRAPRLCAGWAVRGGCAQAGPALGGCRPKASADDPTRSRPSGRLWDARLAACRSRPLPQGFAARSIRRHRRWLMCRGPRTCGHIRDDALLAQAQETRRGQTEA